MQVSNNTTEFAYFTPTQAYEVFISAYANITSLVVSVLSSYLGPSYVFKERILVGVVENIPQDYRLFSRINATTLVYFGSRLGDVFIVSDI